MLKRLLNKAASARLSRYLTMATLAISASLTAQASWIDTDALCQTYGCVVIHDGVSFDVYDKFDSSTGTVISAGQPLIRRLSNPILGAGTVNPVITGSLDEGLTTAPLHDQSAMLGIDTNGDGIGDRFPLDTNNSGFLDAGDSLDSFEITSSTNIVTGSTSAQRSLYITSTTDFYLTAQVLSNLSSPGLSTGSGLASMGFSYRIRRRGNDAGMRFGRSARRGRTYRLNRSVNTLADLAVAPVQIVEFRRAIVRRRSASLPDQSLRFDYVYDFGSYDMSMGNGDLNFEIEFDFYAR